jgi:hypothetical protein
MEFLWSSSNPPSQRTDSAVITQLRYPSRPSPTHQSFHQPLETLTRHNAHSFFTSHQPRHQPLRATDTPPRTLLHKPPAPQLLNTFTTIYGAYKFTTIFARAQHLYPPWASSVQSTRSHPTSLISILVLSCHLRLDLYSIHFLGISSRKLNVHLSSPSCVPHVHKSHHPWVVHMRNIQWQLQFGKLPGIKFSLVSHISSILSTNTNTNTCLTIIFSNNPQLTFFL